MMLLLLDNYDSFTHNVAHALRGLGTDVEVVRNDVATVAELLALEPAGVVLSPGPGGPAEAGVSIELLRAAAGAGTPVFGICLGMQCIAHAFGGTVSRLPAVVHGAASPALHDGTGVFRGLEQGFDAGRYHSLAVDESTLPTELVVSARTPDGVVLGVRHRTLLVEGVQFHPESVLTPRGDAVLANVVQMMTSMPRDAAEEVA